MKKKSIWILIAVVAVLILWGISVNNNMVAMEESVSKAWSNVENVYQRRADLIPNLVNTVKGYAQHETSTFEAVVNARAKATGITVDPANMTAEQLREYQQAQNDVGSALGRLIAISESYPDLKANQNFLELQSQLEGTENRIAVERRNFNEAASKFNTYVRKFPQSFIANMRNFEKKPYFEAEEGAGKAPTVEF
ncbi:MAG: LemA family protein [Bacteroidaceae bacterium]|mgnify:FL=1|jgi:LemA protein|nr:LemA family protein [Bacteroidaceae bacterium]NLA93814.1 LemA family protein [Bacteroidales bacterium]OPZ44792.1 MAG: LemA family protein [Bacteroidetes bacterium ADurb.BinA104]MBP8602245.1 LemA family protein [Bacteroidaceae bacterium]HBA12405.1 LemA family protein [Bacteroidales bacterium]